MALLQPDGSVRTVNPVVTVKANGSAANDPLAEIKAQLAVLAHQNQQLTNYGGIAMDLLCFNIDCKAHYRRGEGRIFFVASADTHPSGQVMSTADIRYWFCHWLCPSCAKRMTIVLTRSGDCVSAQREWTRGVLPLSQAHVS